MNREELKERIIELNKEIYDQANLCRQLGNKNPQDNFMIKDRVELVQKYKKDLEVLENGNN